MILHFWLGAGNSHGGREPAVEAGPDPEDKSGQDFGVTPHKHTAGPSRKPGEGKHTS